MKPETLKSIADQDVKLWVYCGDCHREHRINPLSLPLSPNTLVPSVARRLKCVASVDLYEHLKGWRGLSVGGFEERVKPTARTDS